MEQNNHKFRLRLNLFDAIVLVVVLLAAAAFGYLTLKDKGTDASAPTTQTVQYTVLFQKMNESGSQMVKAGDQLEDTVKNYRMGTVVSVERKPAMVQVLDQETKTYVMAELDGYEDVYVTVESTCTSTDEALLLDSGYDIRVGQTAYVRGPGYMGSGPVTTIERGE